MAVDDEILVMCKWISKPISATSASLVPYFKYALNIYSNPSGAYGQFVEILHKGWERFYHHFSFEVGVGSSLFFWHNRWCQEGPLRDLFPSLYVLTVNRDAITADFCQRRLGAVEWSTVFIHDAFVDDTSLATFLNKFNEITPQDSPDVVIWDLNSKGAFTVNLII